MLLISIGTRIAYMTSLLSHVSALFWNHENCGFVYVIDIHTDVLLSCIYYSVVPIALFWNTGRRFNQYNYDCYLFRLGQVQRLWQRYHQVWVRYFETTNTTVYCMSVLLIHMSYRYFYIILSFQSRSSEPRVVVLINTFMIVTYFYWARIASLTLLLSRASAMFRNY